MHGFKTKTFVGIKWGKLFLIKFGVMYGPLYVYCAAHSWCWMYRHNFLHGNRHFESYLNNVVFETFIEAMIMLSFF